MIDFIYIAYSFLYILLFIGYYRNDFTILALSSMGIVVCAIYTHINGIGGLDNFIVDAFTVINLGIGLYILIKTAIINIEDSAGNRL